MTEGAFIWSPYLNCKFPKKQASDIPCPHIVLPVSNLRAVEWGADIEEEGAYPPSWPSGEWKTWFACSTCGFLSEYFYKDVRWEIVPKLAPGQFHSGANCFCIEFECGQKSCKTLVKLHVEKNGLTETGLSNLLRSPFLIGTLPCGHLPPSLPKDKYIIYKVGAVE